MDLHDEDHEACVVLFEKIAETIAIPAPVLVELDWLGESRRVPARESVLRSIEDGSALVVDLTLADYRRIRELCRQYADLRLGFVDAAVMATVERLGETKVATLDHRHFSVIRPRHTRALTLVP